MKMHFSALESSLDQNVDGVCIKTIQPNTFKGISPCNWHVGKSLWKYPKVYDNLTHKKIFYLWDRLLLGQCPPIKYFGTLLSNMMAHATSRRCLLFISTVPFCWGIFGHVDWCWIPLFWRNSLRLLLKYLVLLSLLKMETFVSNCVSTICAKYLNILET